MTNTCEGAEGDAEASGEGDGMELGVGDAGGVGVGEPDGTWCKLNRHRVAYAHISPLWTRCHCGDRTPAHPRRRMGRAS